MIEEPQSPPTLEEQPTKTQDESKKTKPGIIYLSRIPPAMNPLKIRKSLQQYGTIGRLFLQPEDAATRKQRKKSGGNARKQFTEGWVEYTDKRVAKRVALALNNSTMGGKKGNFHHDDIWNIKYLAKFKWGHIAEKLAYEKAAREQRMRAEIAQVKRETNAYLENVDTGKVAEAIERKKRKKRKHEDAGNAGSGDSLVKKYRQKPVVERTMKPLTEKKDSTSETVPTTLNKGLLSKILTSG